MYIIFMAALVLFVFGNLLWISRTWRDALFAVAVFCCFVCLFYGYIYSSWLAGTRVLITIIFIGYEAFKKTR